MAGARVCLGRAGGSVFGRLALYQNNTVGGVLVLHPTKAWANTGMDRRAGEVGAGRHLRDDAHVGGVPLRCYCW